MFQTSINVAQYLKSSVSCHIQPADKPVASTDCQVGECKLHYCSPEAEALPGPWLAHSGHQPRVCLRISRHRICKDTLTNSKPTASKSECTGSKGIPETRENKCRRISSFHKILSLFEVYDLFSRDKQ